MFSSWYLTASNPSVYHDISAARKRSDERYLCFARCRNAARVTKITTSFSCHFLISNERWVLYNRDTCKTRGKKCCCSPLIYVKRYLLLSIKNRKDQKGGAYDAFYRETTESLVEQTLQNLLQSCLNIVGRDIWCSEGAIPNRVIDRLVHRQLLLLLQSITLTLHYYVLTINIAYTILSDL